MPYLCIRNAGERPLSLLIYHIFLRIYRLGIWLLSPWNRKAAAWLTGRKGLMDRIRASGISDKSQTVWMHCASLGEFEQGRPVLEALKFASPGITTCITFFSPSGYEAAKAYKGADFIFYLPLDSALIAKRFLNSVKPGLVLWVKYEYWYHDLSELRRRKIPCLLISPLFRQDQPFFK